MELAEHPEPDGKTKFAAPATSGYSGMLMYLVGPWRIFYRMNARLVTIVLIAPVAM